MQEYILLSKNEIMDLCKDKPVEINISENPNIFHSKTLTGTICSEEYFNKIQGKITKDEALKAARTIQAYCKTISEDCKGCCFYRDNCPIGCGLNDPDHLPETWEIEDDTNMGKDGIDHR